MVPFYSSSVSMERFNNKHNNYNLHSVVLKRVELWQGFLPRIIRDEGLWKKSVEKGAVSKETAKTHEELDMSKSSLEHLVSVKDIKKTEDGRYYVPRERW